MVDINKHFEEFYHKILFCGKSLGEEEKTYEVDKYFTGYHDEEEDKYVFASVYKESEKDERVYLRLNGLILTLVYGAWYNKKYKELDVYIHKDPYYKGKENANIKDILKLLDDYISTNYKEYLEKINKVIVGPDKTKDITIKYKNSNILTRDNIKIMAINDADIKNEDIEYLSKYKNLQSLRFNNCHLTADNFSLLNTWSIYIINSILKNMYCFNDLKADSLKLNSTRVEEAINKNTTMEVSNLGIDQTDIDIALFFLMTNFKKLYSLLIDGKKLTPDEVNLLKVLYQIKELAVDGKCYSFDFLDDLPTLEQFRGIIELVSKDDYSKYKDLYAKTLDWLKDLDKPDERFRNYVFHHTKDKNLKRKKFYREIKVPKIAQTRWEGYIASCKDEDVRKIMNLPWSKRKKLGCEDELDFKYVETKFTDPFNILAKTDDEFLSKIVGPTGERLAKVKRYGNYRETGEYYIFGPNGKVYESIECTRERDILVPESISELDVTLAKNDNNIFDYYYNRQVSEEEKVDYLVSPVIDYLYQANDKDFSLEYEHNLDLIKELTLINKKINEIMAKEETLFYGPISQAETTIKIHNGHEVECERVLPNAFLPEDINLYQALKRTHDIELIRYSLEKHFEYNKTSKEEREATWKNVYALLDLWKQSDELKAKIQVNDAIVLKHFSKYYEEILTDFEKENYLNWYLDDVNNFLDHYELDIKTRELLTKYILMRQSRYRADLNNELDKIKNRLFILDEYYSIFSLLEWNQKYEGDFDFDKWFRDGEISRIEYEALKEYHDLDELSDDLGKILDFDKHSREDAYKEMIPVIDNFSSEDLKDIKDKFFIANEFRDKFEKYVDFLYYYINGHYPKWIELELAKCPKLEEKYESSVEREIVPEHTLHLDANIKINRNPFN